MWYHQARERHSGLINTLKAQYQLGLDPTFFDILGDHANPLEKKQFHELSFFQRVWILKALCDNCLVGLLTDVDDEDNKDDKDVALFGMVGLWSDDVALATIV